METVKRPMTFEDLESWRQARQLTREIYALTRKHAISKDFSLCGQIQRAGISAMSNLAEGFERRHLPEKLQFYNVAHASLAEVRSLTYVIEDNYAAVAADAAGLRNQAMDCGQLTGGLIRSTETRKTGVTKLLSSLSTLLSSVALLHSSLSTLHSSPLGRP